MYNPLYCDQKHLVLVHATSVCLELHCRPMVLCYQKNYPLGVYINEQSMNSTATDTSPVASFPGLHPGFVACNTKSGAGLSFFRMGGAWERDYLSCELMLLLQQYQQVLILHSLIRKPHYCTLYLCPVISMSLHGFLYQFGNSLVPRPRP